MSARHEGYSECDRFAFTDAQAPAGLPSVIFDYKLMRETNAPEPGIPGRHGEIGRKRCPLPRQPTFT